jgi:hypothetical protein
MIWCFYEYRVKMERVDCSETRAYFNQTTDCHLPEGRNIHIQGSGKSRVLIQIFWEDWSFREDSFEVYNWMLKLWITYFYPIQICKQINTTHIFLFWTRRYCTYYELRKYQMTQQFRQYILTKQWVLFGLCSLLRIWIVSVSKVSLGTNNSDGLFVTLSPSRRIVV